MVLGRFRPETYAAEGLPSNLYVRSPMMTRRVLLDQFVDQFGGVWGNVGVHGARNSGIHAPHHPLLPLCFGFKSRRSDHSFSARIARETNAKGGRATASSPARGR